MDVPTMKRVTGMSATSRMMNGTERKPLMMAPRIVFSSGSVRATPFSQDHDECERQTDDKRDQAQPES